MSRGVQKCLWTHSDNSGHIGVSRHLWTCLDTSGQVDISDTSEQVETPLEMLRHFWALSVSTDVQTPPDTSRHNFDSGFWIWNNFVK